MKKYILTFAVFAFILTGFQSCKEGEESSTELENTDLVESGTYLGVAQKVDDEEQEIYFETEDGKVLELYFTEQTELSQNGQVVAFDILEQGQQLEVTVEKKGKRLEPVRVVIVE